MSAGRIDHAMGLWESPSSGACGATCICGWRGPRRATVEKARDDWELHFPVVAHIHDFYPIPRGPFDPELYRCPCGEIGYPVRTAS